MSNKNLIKRLMIIAHSILFFCFLLDMTGFKVFDRVLVDKAFKDDGIFMLIYIILLIVFYLKPKFGKIPLITWLVMWFSLQFYFHWWVTIAGPMENRMNYFEGTLKLINSHTRYIPDVYHIVLHILIVFALYTTFKYTRRD